MLGALNICILHVFQLRLPFPGMDASKSKNIFMKYCTNLYQFLIKKVNNMALQWNHLDLLKWRVYKMSF